MRVSLLVAGYLRTFKDNVSNIKKFLIDPFENVDIYVHITKNEEDDRYLNPQTLKEVIECVESEMSPLCMLIEDNVQYSIDKRENDTINLWAKFNKLNELKKKNELDGKVYDLVIKARPDVAFIDLEILDTCKKIVIPTSSKIDKQKLRNADDKHICDIFAYGPSELMDKYFDIHSSIFDLIKKYGSTSETLLWHHLNDLNTDYELKEIQYGVILSSCNTFAIAGDSGSGKTTLGRLLKTCFSNSFLLECDRYHKWERHDKMWKELTHLNPNANYIAKMTEDIFNLKLGNSIYQVDYDHDTGKFTEKERIDSADNIIVCGLHSLYDPKHSLYNVKVFMDTEDSLRIDWKCNRDTLVRKYSRDDVMKQIQSREEDYKAYILPQRDSADIIVRFYKKDGGEGIVQLQMSIRKSLNMKHVIDFMEESGVITQRLPSTIDFDVIEFSQYRHSDKWSFTLDDNLINYNYILYILLNIGRTKQ
jgi:uridine kinase